MFNEYLRMADKSDSAAHRRDPLSVYLDALELQFGN
jgi:hypothetical protein